MPDLVIVIYAGLGLVLGGVAVAVEVGRPPTMIERADARAEHRPPRSKIAPAILFGLIVAIFWPALVVAAIFGWGARKR